ncbi:MAG: hypothetical protein LWX56_10905 [Ignavibacteria bacterium]|nr:hypothetical protein [Ignavibacteria bacterium]
MKRLLFIVFGVCSLVQSFAGEPLKSTPAANSFFPANEKVALIYQTSFGDSKTTFCKKGNYTQSLSEADKFVYRQLLSVQDNGVYVKETHQLLRILWGIKKTGDYTYSRPLLRFPLPLVPGKTWTTECMEYNDGDSSLVKVTGKMSNYETVVTPAGKFQAIKVESTISKPGEGSNIVTEWYADGVGMVKSVILIKGGGLIGMLRDFLGYGTIEFELKEIKKL